ncbi:hypothetical protein [Methanolapillus millepedarum]|uniref:Uncharacterized protein n=1 Tax=Methanolapillus millepedarum TaxID=3028296 RepID=A0AA96ZW62_9EURY|nr:hypothetical protein MsAc7_17840 [Methanosarcinaceae archaeon Ac7]
MKEHGDTVDSLGEVFDIGPKTVRLKLGGHISFSPAELDYLITKYKLSDEEIKRAFIGDSDEFLLKKMKEHGDTVKSVSDELNMTEEKFKNKLSHKEKFTEDEVYFLINKYHLSVKDSRRAFSSHIKMLRTQKRIYAKNEKTGEEKIFVTVAAAADFFMISPTIIPTYIKNSKRLPGKGKDWEVRYGEED